MKVIYLAGPYRAETVWQTHRNIRTAEEYAAKLWNMGAAAVCPHKNSAHLDGCADEKVFLDGYLEIVKRCDAVLLLPSWNTSIGAASELALAERCNIPVFDYKNLGELLVWMATDKSEQKGATCDH